MINKYPVLLFTVFILILTSCVSKKKFLEMQAGRLSAEEQVRQLTQENNDKAARIEAMIADYEEMKNALLENNAIKDQYIDSLNQVAYALKEQLNEQKESLESTSFNLDFEKQRLSEELETRNQTIKRLEAQVKQLENDISSNSSLLDQKNFDISRLQEKVNTLTTEKERAEERLETLRNQLAQVKSETEELKQQLNEKDATITRLENNVKLLKKEIGEG